MERGLPRPSCALPYGDASIEVPLAIALPSQSCLSNVHLQRVERAAYCMAFDAACQLFLKVVALPSSR